VGVDDDPTIHPLPRPAYVDYGGLDAAAHFTRFLRPVVEQYASTPGSSRRCGT
jgi:hypothetical protein